MESHLLQIFLSNIKFKFKKVASIGTIGIRLKDKKSSYKYNFKSNTIEQDSKRFKRKKLNM